MAKPADSGLRRRVVEYVRQHGEVLYDGSDRATAALAKSLGSYPVKASRRKVAGVVRDLRKEGQFVHSGERTIRCR